MKNTRKSRLVKTIVDDELIVETGSSHRSKWEKDKKFRSLKTYSVDTYLLNYSPRLLKVPSKEYPTLQCALDDVKPRHGGYVIELVDPSMIYTIDRPMEDDQADILIIRGVPQRGPNNPFNGRSFTQRVSHRALVEDITGRHEVTLPTEPLYRFIPSAGCSASPADGCFPGLDERTFGVGPFDIQLHGQTFTVRSDTGQDPCFDQVPIGSRVLLITDDASISNIPRGSNVRPRDVFEYATVTGVRGNSITVSASGTGLSTMRPTSPLADRTIAHGTGFVFVSDIRVQVLHEGISMEVMDYLSFENLELDASAMFYIHATRGTVTLRNCWISNQLTIRGRYFLKIPNVFTGLLILWPASDGEAYCQTMFSFGARMQGITTTGFWSYCHFLNMAHGAEMMHGSNMNFTGSEFVRCCLAISAQARSHIVLTNVIIAHCRCAVMLVYNSMASSVNTSIPGAPTDQLLLGPWFLFNVFMIVVFRNSEFIGPMTNGVHNLIPFIIDGKVYTTIESNPLMNIGSFNSMALVISNPFVPEPKRFGCTTLDELIEFDILDAWGVASPGFVAEMSSLENEYNVLAQETIDRIQSNDRSGRDRWGNNLIQID